MSNGVVRRQTQIEFLAERWINKSTSLLNWSVHLVEQQNPRFDRSIAMELPSPVYQKLSALTSPDPSTCCSTPSP